MYPYQLHMTCLNVIMIHRLITNYPNIFVCVCVSVPVPQNPDAYLHPFTLGREYQRALNATKLERVFAKPFLCGLDGHRDGIQALAKFPTRLAHVLSAASDGEVCLYQKNSLQWETVIISSFKFKGSLQV